MSLLFTAILVWIFHTLSTKKSRENGTRSAEGCEGLPARYCLHMQVPQIPGRTGQRMAGRACAVGLGAVWVSI